MSQPASSGADDAAGVFEGKRVNGPKRFIVTDTLGLLVTVWVLAASWQDRDGAKGALLAAVAATPIRHMFADQGFAGRLVGWAAAMLNLTLDIVRKPADQKGFAVHPRRWVVERSLGWLMGHHRPARDHERRPETSEDMIRWAACVRLTLTGPADQVIRSWPNSLLAPVLRP